MHFKYPIIILLLVLVTTATYGQSLPVSVQVSNSVTNRPVPNARLLLTMPSGNASGKTYTTDSNGIARLMLEQGINYYTEITTEGYNLFATQLQADSSNRLFKFSLQPAHSLKGAVVTASKSLMRQEDDKTIVDPEQLAASASSSYEVLEKTPGIIADQDGNFYMTSTTPATIYINGREIKMSNTDIASMLKSLPPNAISKIEILRTPSAKYDASGSGGIINIVLKKGIKLGLTGSVNAGMQQGVYGNQFAGVNINYGDDNKSAYLNVNYARRESLEQINSLRQLSPDSMLNQESGSVYSGQNVYLGYGATSNRGSKWELNYDGRVSGSFSDNKTDNTSLLNERTNNELLTSTRTGTINRGNSWNIDQGIGLKYKIDTTGSEWTSSLNWNGNFANSIQDIDLRFVTPSLSALTNNGDIKTTRHYLAFQTDVKYKYKWQLTFEAGIKTTGNFFRHNSDYLATYNGLSYPDVDRSATYRYSENINAAYFQVSKSIKDIIIKPGIRLENTNMIGHQTRPGNSDFTIRRTDLFPYIYISKKVMTIAHYDLRAYLVYRRTIYRPAYDYLNPFQRFLDPYLYETGNPALRPQFTQNYEANISIDERPMIAIGQNDITDVFANVVYQSDSNKSVAYRTYDNLGHNRETYIRAMGAIPPGGTYFFVLGGQYNLNNYDGLYNNEPLRYRRESWTFFTYHTLKLGKNTNFVLNGFMRLNGLMQFYELGTFGMLNASLTHHFLNKKLQVTVSAQDIFYTNQYNYSINQGSVIATGSRYNDSQRFGINLRYNFGIRAREEKKDFLNMDTDKQQ